MTTFPENPRKTSSKAWQFAREYIAPPEYDPEWFKANPADNISGRARTKQRPPEEFLNGDKMVWLLMAGRGFGKSRTGAGWLDLMARTRCVPGEQMLIAGRTPSDVRDYALHGPGGLLTNYPDITYEPSKRQVTWPNGVVALIRSGANPEEFRGFSGQFAWIEELAAWQYPDEAWENMRLGMRERVPKIAITSTPKPIKLIREIIDSPGTVTTIGSSFENADNLSDVYVENVLEPLKDTRRGRQEVYAELLFDVEGALWRMLTDPETGIPGIDDLRTPFGALPPMQRVVVGVDPQGVKKDGALTGIIVCGLGEDNRGYVMKDCSINGTPLEWGRAVVRAFKKYKADRVVVEKNYGGQMAISNLRTIDPGLPIKEVNASRGKIIRAEPVAALYEQRRVHHAGVLPELEDEMIFYEGDGDSPNRLDALVWAITELMLLKKKRGGTWGSRNKFRNAFGI